MLVHFIWLGDKEIPSEYIYNYNRCASLNFYTSFRIWRNDALFTLLEDNGYTEYWSNLNSFICKYNFLKYLILGKYPGIYSDLDIYWNKSFSEIIKYMYPKADILLSALNHNKMFLNDTAFTLLDDPFIYVKKPDLYLDCLEFCKNRSQEDLKYNGEHFEKTGEKIIREEEPIGPFGMTEWVRKKNINVDFFYQYRKLDTEIGEYGFHNQLNTWK
jgi:hypothetical protein